MLEVNTNPCISPDGGFFAAAVRAGLALPDLFRLRASAAASSVSCRLQKAKRTSLRPSALPRW